MGTNDTCQSMIGNLSKNLYCATITQPIKHFNMTNRIKLKLIEFVIKQKNQINFNLQQQKIIIKIDIPGKNCEITHKN